jgi:amidophosphoribosyltransferase
MCGISGVIYKSNHNAFEIFQTMLSLQHRGQDGAGMYWNNEKHSGIIKSPGLISEIFTEDILKELSCKIYIGHNRYKTNNIRYSYQPFEIKDNELNISVVHNGNITNCEKIKKTIRLYYNIDTTGYSDTYILTHLIFYTLKNIMKEYNNTINFYTIMVLSKYLQKYITGSFSLLIYIHGLGLVAMRDKHGIRPLSYGKCDEGYMVSSENCSFNHNRFKFERDINPGETILFSDGNCQKFQFNEKNSILYTPCLFEFIYFSRLDTTISNISVYSFRYMLGESLAKVIGNIDIDYIIPTPETSRVYAYGLSYSIDIPIQECLIGNRYMNRTFIGENKNNISEKIKQKFSIVDGVIKGKNVLLIDDSIIRGNTSKGIVELLKKAGVNKIYMASGAPKVLNTNNFGIFIESKDELITQKYKSNKDISNYLGVEDVFYNELDDALSIAKYLNPDIKSMEVSMFIDV